MYPFLYEYKASDHLSQNQWKHKSVPATARLVTYTRELRESHWRDTELVSSAATL